MNAGKSIVSVHRTTLLGHVSIMKISCFDTDFVSKIKLTKLSLKYVTEYHTADIETLKTRIENEREEREMGFNSVMREREVFIRNMTQLTVQIDQVTKRIHENMSSELPVVAYIIAH